MVLGFQKADSQHAFSSRILWRIWLIQKTGRVVLDADSDALNRFSIFTHLGVLFPMNPDHDDKKIFEK